jgi:hypothetical protein
VTACLGPRAPTSRACPYAEQAETMATNLW